MRYHLFQNFFGKMVKTKKTSFHSTREDTNFLPPLYVNFQTKMLLCRGLNIIHDPQLEFEYTNVFTTFWISPSTFEILNYNSELPIGPRLVHPSPNLYSHCSVRGLLNGLSPSFTSDAANKIVFLSHVAIVGRENLSSKYKK